jgi:hypothetical protein
MNSAGLKRAVAALVLQGSGSKSMASPPPPLSDNPYDNYIKEKLAPAAAPPPTRERCANVYDSLMACLMKSKASIPNFPQPKH